MDITFDETVIYNWIDELWKEPYFLNIFWNTDLRWWLPVRSSRGRVELDGSGAGRYIEDSGGLLPPREHWAWAIPWNKRKTI